MANEITVTVENWTNLHRLLYELIDTGECWYDHHGYCQGHNLHENPCPHARAKAIIEEDFPEWKDWP